MMQTVRNSVNTLALILEHLAGSKKNWPGGVEHGCDCLE